MTATQFYGLHSNSATDSLVMSYDDLWRVTGKSQRLSQSNIVQHGTLNAGYDMSYAYDTSWGKHYQMKDVVETHYRTEGMPTAADSIQSIHSYSYDPNGNLAHESVARKHLNGDTTRNISERKLLWNGMNRLKAISENGYVSLYWYDADGNRTVKEQEGNADEMSNLAAIPAGKPWRIQFEGMNKEGVNIGVYAIYKNDVENTYIENSYILFENGEEHTFLAPLCADILLLGQYEMIDVKDKGLLELERQEDFPTDLFKGWNVLHVSEDGTTTNTEGLSGHDAFDMGVAFVGTSSPWYDENGKENYQVDKNQIPEWVEGFEVDTTCYSSASLAGYNKVRPVCKPLPGGLSGRVCSLDICGRAGIVGNNKIVIIQGSDPSDIPVFRGDANGDLQVSVNDILAIVNYLNDHPNSLFIYANADADGNGKIDMEDIKTIVMIILGLENVSD